jgi:hypothetical protein
MNFPECYVELIISLKHLSNLTEISTLRDLVMFVMNFSSFKQLNYKKHHSLSFGRNDKIVEVFSEYAIDNKDHAVLQVDGIKIENETWMNIFNLLNEKKEFYRSKLEELGNTNFLELEDKKRILSQELKNKHILTNETRRLITTGRACREKDYHVLHTLLSQIEEMEKENNELVVEINHRREKSKEKEVINIILCNISLFFDAAKKGGVLIL